MGKDGDLVGADGRIVEGWQIAPHIMAQPPAAWLCEIDAPAEEVLPSEYVVAREMKALHESGDLAAVRQALKHLIFEALPRSRVLYQKSQRESAKAAIEAVLEFLDLFRSLHQVQTTIPLRALLRGLESLDLGAVEPMLQPKKSTGRPVTLQSVMVRSYAAAGAELARRSGSGCKLAAACKFVADRLNAAGYRLAAGHGHGAITGETVRAWRQEVLTRGKTDPMREIYDQLLASDRRFSADWRVDAFFDELRAWAPPAESENPLA
jgi:hypothetical protein